MKTEGVIQKVSLIISNKKLVIKVKIHLFIFREQEEYKKKTKLKREKTCHWKYTWVQNNRIKANEILPPQHGTKSRKCKAYKNLFISATRSVFQWSSSLTNGIKLVLDCTVCWPGILLLFYLMDNDYKITCTCAGEVIGVWNIKHLN